MACCSPFSATIAAQAADPTRHVNFVTGMVLGVDDYGQEFAYHSARDKWIVRDFLGYGTLSGLAVTAEADGGNGPRIRVMAGSAAAPSGQMICVGRDQCASLNAWLARKETLLKLDEITGASVVKDAATLNLFLTLCYVDCAVAEVPIPGEPCRSDENLMAPSRIADDYCLELRFEPPAMTEARAIDALAALHASVATDSSTTDNPSNLATAVRRADVQLRLALGLPEPAPAPTKSDYDPILLNPAAPPAFGAAVKRLWVTRIRPLVAAQRCGAPTATANDCVLLARLTVPVVKVATHWEVKGGADPQTTSVEIDESERPLLVATNVAQTPLGRALEADPRGQKLVVLQPGVEKIDITSGLVVLRAPTTKVTVPAATRPTAGKTLTIKSADAGKVTIGTPPSTKIDGANTFELPERGSVSLVSDGANTWHVVSVVR